MDSINVNSVRAIAATLRDIQGRAEKTASWSQEFKDVVARARQRLSSSTEATFPTASVFSVLLSAIYFKKTRLTDAIVGSLRLLCSKNLLPLNDSITVYDQQTKCDESLGSALVSGLSFFCTMQAVDASVQQRGLELLLDVLGGTNMTFFRGKTVTRCVQLGCQLAVQSSSERTRVLSQLLVKKAISCVVREFVGHCVPCEVPNTFASSTILDSWADDVGFDDMYTPIHVVQPRAVRIALPADISTSASREGREEVDTTPGSLKGGSYSVGTSGTHGRCTSPSLAAAPRGVRSHPVGSSLAACLANADVVGIRGSLESSQPPCSAAVSLDFSQLYSPQRSDELSAKAGEPRGVDLGLWCGVSGFVRSSTDDSLLHLAVPTVGQLDKLPPQTRDMLLLIRHTCRLASRPVSSTSDTNPYVRGRQLGLDMLQCIFDRLPTGCCELEHPSATWVGLVLAATKYEIARCVVRNVATVAPSAFFTAAISIIETLLYKVHFFVAREIHSILAIVVFPLVESEFSSFQQKLTVLTMVQQVLSVPHLCVALYVNYDCNPFFDTANKFGGMLELLVDFVTGMAFSGQQVPDWLTSEQERLIRTQCVHIMYSFAESMQRWICEDPREYNRDRKARNPVTPNHQEHSTGPTGPDGVMAQHSRVISPVSSTAGKSGVALFAKKSTTSLSSSGRRKSASDAAVTSRGSSPGASSGEDAQGHNASRTLLVPPRRRPLEVRLEDWESDWEDQEASRNTGADSEDGGVRGLFVDSGSTSAVPFVSAVHGAPSESATNADTANFSVFMRSSTGDAKPFELSTNAVVGATGPGSAWQTASLEGRSANICYHWKHIHLLLSNKRIIQYATQLVNTKKWKEARQYLEVKRLLPSGDDLAFARWIRATPGIERLAVCGIFERINKDAECRAVVVAYFRTFHFAGVPIDIALRDTTCEFISWDRPTFESQVWESIQGVFGAEYARQNPHFITTSDADAMAGVLLFLHTSAHNLNARSTRMTVDQFVRDGSACMEFPPSEEEMRAMFARVSESKWELDALQRTPRELEIRRRLPTVSACLFRGAVRLRLSTSQPAWPAMHVSLSATTGSLTEAPMPAPLARTNVSADQLSFISMRSTAQACDGQPDNHSADDHSDTVNDCSVAGGRAALEPTPGVTPAAFPAGHSIGTPRIYRTTLGEGQSVKPQVPRAVESSFDAEDAKLLDAEIPPYADNFEPVKTRDVHQQMYLRLAVTLLRQLEGEHRRQYSDRYYVQQPYVMPFYAQHVRPMFLSFYPHITATQYICLRLLEEEPTLSLAFDLSLLLYDIAAAFVINVSDLRVAVDRIVQDCLKVQGAARLGYPTRVAFAPILLNSI